MTDTPNRRGSYHGYPSTHVSGTSVSPIRLRCLVVLLTLALLTSVLPSPTLAVLAPSGVSITGGFAQELVASELSSPTDFAFLPDGRILIAEKVGVVRVWKNGALLAEPLLDIRGAVNDYWERGLLAIEASPDFASDGAIFLFYNYEVDRAEYEGPKTSRVSRFIVVGDVADRLSEVPILGTVVGRTCTQFPEGSDCLPANYRSHSGGGLSFAADGSLFVGTGDGAGNQDFERQIRAQDLASLSGKLLHVDRDGQGLATNPFWNGDPASIRSKVWASGLRQPFRLEVQPGSGVPVVGDVGWLHREEINAVPAGANLGWPCYEGTLQHAIHSARRACQVLYAQGPAVLTWPLLEYDRADGAAVIGGPFYSGGAFPEQYRGAYFYGDYTAGAIRWMRLDDAGRRVGEPTDFATGLDGPVAIAEGSDGALYYLSTLTGELRRIRPDNAPETDAGGGRRARLLGGAD
jgi:glucose/arabinose dehydrogenase